MFVVDNNLKISMNEGDFGVILGINFTDVNETDVVFKIYNKEMLLEKTFENVTDNKVELKLSKEDTSKLTVGTYNYDIYQYKEGILKNTLLKGKTFVVKEGA